MIKKTKGLIRIEGDFYKLFFDEKRGGEITGIDMFDGVSWLKINGKSIPSWPSLEIEDEGGNIFKLRDRKSTFKLISQTSICTRFRFISQFGKTKSREDRLLVELTYTVYKSGVLFCDFKLKWMNKAKPFLLRRCSLGMSFDLSKVTWFRWWDFKRPKLDKMEWDEAGNVMTVSTGKDGLDRFMSENDSRQVVGSLDPYVGMDFGRRKRFSNHIEFFLEDWRAVGTEDRTKVGNSFLKKGPDMVFQWDLLKGDVVKIKPGYVYRNRWGIGLSKTKQTGRTLGQRVYHWFDKGTQPSDEIIDKMAKFGGTILCLHESSWPIHPVRCDEVKDEERTRALIARCHKNGIRVLFYSRLYEKGLKKGWFSKFLNKNYDGIYVDGGTPWCILEEDYRFPVRRFYRTMRLVRRTIGKNGLFISHTGPWITAVGEDLVDGYLSGEQEKGHLMDALESNLFYTSQAIAVPMIWTAAFPQYRSPRAAAFYAGVGEFPHINLGVQLPGPLSHPKDPTYRQYIVPLWLMWKSVPMSKAKLYSLNNYLPVVDIDKKDVLAAVYKVSERYFLILVANISDNNKKNITIRFKRAILGIRGEYTGYEMYGSNYWDFAVNKLTEAVKDKIFIRKLEPYGIRGYVMYKGNKPSYLNKYLEEMKTKEKIPPTDYLEYVKRAKIAPENARHIEVKSKDKVFMSLEIHELILGPVFAGYYRIEIWNTEFAMTFTVKGYIGANGYTKRNPTKTGELIKTEAGKYNTGPIDLTPFLTRGSNIVSIITIGQMTPNSPLEPVYFVGKVKLNNAEKTIAREYVFDNEVDKDWSTITFSIAVQK